MAITIAFSMGMLVDGPLNRQELADEIAARLIATVSGANGTFQEGGTAPTTDIGPWHPAGANYWEFWDVTASSYKPSAIVPVGAIVMWPSDSPPDGWLVCDGSVVGQATYPSLFTYTSYRYSFFGTDGTQTADTAALTAASQFRLPDFRGRFPLGAGDGTPNEAGGPNPLTRRIIGQRGGQESVTIKQANLPTLFLPVFEYNSSATQSSVALYGGYKYDPGTAVAQIVNTTSSTDTANMPPNDVVNFIIRT